MESVSISEFISRSESQSRVGFCRCLSTPSTMPKKIPEKLRAAGIFVCPMIGCDAQFTTMRWVRFHVIHVHGRVIDCFNEEEWLKGDLTGYKWTSPSMFEAIEAQVVVGKVAAHKISVDAVKRRLEKFAADIKDKSKAVKGPMVVVTKGASKVDTGATFKGPSQDQGARVRPTVKSGSRLKANLAKEGQVAKPKGNARECYPRLVRKKMK